jgi:hypothetical protein
VALQNYESDFQLWHISPFFRVEQAGSYWPDFREILYWGLLLKAVKKVKFGLKRAEMSCTSHEHLISH